MRILLSFLAIATGLAALPLSAEGRNDPFLHCASGAASLGRVSEAEGLELVTTGGRCEALSR